MILHPCIYCNWLNKSFLFLPSNFLLQSNSNTKDSKKPSCCYSKGHSVLQDTPELLRIQKCIGRLAMLQCLLLRKQYLEFDRNLPHSWCNWQKPTDKHTIVGLHNRYFCPDGKAFLNCTSRIALLLRRNCLQLYWTCRCKYDEILCRH